MLKRGMASIVGVLVVGLLVAGCGGDDDDGDASAAGEGTITKTEFVKQGNAICKRSTQKFASGVEKLLGSIANKARPVKQPPTAGELLSKVVVPELETEADQIGALGAPDGDDEQVDAISSGYQETIERLEADPQKYSEEAEPYKEAEKALKAYGLAACPFG